MENFLILTTQRTGSTYIGFWLNQHPQIRCYNEIFLPHYPALDGFHYFFKKNNLLKWYFYKNRYLHKISSITDGHLIKTIIQSDLKAFFKDLYFNPDFPLPFDSFSYDDVFLNVKKAKTKQFKLTGFKLMYSHLKSNAALKSWIRHETPKIIFLERTDKLAQCHSKIYKNKLDFAHSEKNIAIRKYRAEVNVFRKCLKGLLTEEKKILSFLEGQNHFRISYEDFFNKEGKKKKMLNYLGVTDQFNPVVKLKKINKIPLSEIIINYKEIDKLVRSTIVNQERV